MLRILHFSDLHLESSFAMGGLPSSIGSWRRADLRATLGRILSLARERKVDAVTIAGDLYEQDYAPPDTADFLEQQFARLAPIRVFITPGEHDPYTQDSIYALARWPENVTIFSERKLSAVELAPGISLWGAACPPARRHRTLDGFTVDRDGVNLLLLHAAHTTTDDKTLFSVDAKAILASGFAFALLGHRHAGQIWPEDSAVCAYPGSPEPLVAEEMDGAHQVVLLNIQDGLCTPKPISTSQWNYLSLRVGLSDCESIEEAANLIEQSLQTSPNGDDERAIYRVTLTGLPAFTVDLDDLAAQMKTKAYLHYEAGLALPYNLEQLAQEQTVRGMLIRRFQARIEGAKSLRERTMAESALLCALRVLEGRQVGLDEIR
jgi:DNA repair exonuclease SbcCD nuclease subunit